VKFGIVKRISERGSGSLVLLVQIRMEMLTRDASKEVGKYFTSFFRGREVEGLTTSKLS